MHLSWADGLAELARDAPLLAAGVAAQRVLAAEARAEGALLEGVVDGHLAIPQQEQVNRLTCVLYWKSRWSR